MVETKQNDNSNESKYLFKEQEMTGQINSNTTIKWLLNQTMTKKKLQL